VGPMCWFLAEHFPYVKAVYSYRKPILRYQILQYLLEMLLEVPQV
jgi:hypothetical protein